MLNTLIVMIVIRQCLLRLNDYRLLKKYTKILERVSISKNIEFDSEPVYGDNDK